MDTQIVSDSRFNFILLSHTKGKPHPPPPTIHGTQTAAVMSFSDIGTGNAPSTIRPSQRSSIAAAIGTPAGSNAGDTSDLADSLRSFQVRPHSMDISPYPIYP